MIAEARDGEEAVAFAREHEPDLIVMDVKMPHLDGIDAARRILEERPVPIVMLTAYGQEELVARAVEAGVFGYLVKPFREQDLVPALATAQARHEELAAARAEAETLSEALAARKLIERAKGLLMAKEKPVRAGSLRPSAQGEPGIRPPVEGDRRSRDRYLRRDMSSAPTAPLQTPPRERARRSRGSGLGNAWRVIVLNDNHNTFEGVAFALAQTIPGVDYEARDGARDEDRPHRAGDRLVGPP